MRSWLTTLTLCWTLALAATATARTRVAPAPGSPAKGVPQRGEGELFPSQVLHRGATVTVPTGILVHPVRWREVRVILAETLPAAERERDAAQAALVDLRTRPVPPCPERAAVESWAAAWKWGAAGLTLGAVAVAVLWVTVDAPP